MGGLLDFLNSDDGKLGLGLLAAAGPSAVPMSFGQRLQGAMQGLEADKQNAIRTGLMKSQMDNLSSEIAMRKAQMAKMTDGLSLLGKVLGGQSAPQFQPGQLGSGSFGVTPNANPMAPAAAGPSGLASATPEQIALLKAQLGVDLMPEYRVAHEGFERKAGSFYDVPGKGREFVADPTKGMDYDPITKTVSPLKGYLDFTGAQTSAQERAKANEQIVTVPDGKGGTNQMFGSALRTILPGGQMGQSPGGDFRGDFVGDPAQVRAAINAIKDPQERSQAMRALENQLSGNNPARTGMGPSMGMGGTASLGGFGYTPPASVLEADKARAVESEKSGRAYQDVLNDKVDNEFQLVNRNKQIEPLLERFKTGGFAPEERLHIANALQTSGTLPESLRNTLASWVAGGDPTAGKVIENQLAAAGITTMLDTLNKEGKPNRAIFQQVQKAQESLKSGNATLKDVFELQRRLYDIHYQEQQALNKSIKDGSYNPATWAADYSSVRHSSLGQPAAPLPSTKEPQAIPIGAKPGDLIKGQTYKLKGGGVGVWNGMAFDVK